MTSKPFFPVMRELVRCYQAFEMLSASNIRTLGLTPSQFDIIATLGNTKGMTSKLLGEKTLITKGTMTGVVDRLIDKGLVRRTQCEYDGRSQIIQLTTEGEKVFESVFPIHVAYIGQFFEGVQPEDYVRIQEALRDLRMLFEKSDKTP